MTVPPGEPVDLLAALSESLTAARNQSDSPTRGAPSERAGAPCGDPVEQLAARNTGHTPPEFYAPAKPRPLGDPAQDPPMTVRVERWEDRMRPDVRRAVKTDVVRFFGQSWVIATGPSGEKRWLTDDEVRTWPVCPAVVNEAAYHQVCAPREGRVQPAERGDLDVTVFKGGKP